MYIEHEIDTKPDDTYLNALNEHQYKAVMETEGPVLVLAGAGTGKTRVLTAKVAHIVRKGLCAPYNILVVTFTNKAANEMKERIHTIIGEATKDLWIGTFHSIAAKMLRRHAAYIGLQSNFSIVDYSEQTKIIKQILKNMNVDDKKVSVKNLLYMIDNLKNKGVSYKNMNAKYDQLLLRKYTLSSIYKAYQELLIANNALDFGDMMLYVLDLLQNDDIAADYQSQFRYILVDEYQDTNKVQDQILQRLACKHLNICCVGDEDQLIYGWRGAEVDNIMGFEQLYNGAKVIRLELNYRSTSCILNVALSVIRKNKLRYGKMLWTEGAIGEPVRICAFRDDTSEAAFVAREIMRLKKDYPLSKMAILTRAGYQTLPFEECFNRELIPYKVFGGLSFYQRLEIKDVISHIRILVNKSDNIAFERMMFSVKRGFGEGALNTVRAVMQEHKMCMFDAVKLCLEYKLIKGVAYGGATKVMQCFDKTSIAIAKSPADAKGDVVRQLLNDIGYMQNFVENTEENKERLDNINILLLNMAHYKTLEEYIEYASLVSDNDVMQSEDKVMIMTMHGAKGLEFDVVFLVGWEEGVFPSQRSITEGGNNALEEERRLAYVGITRAKQLLYITRAIYRRQYNGYPQYNEQSRFLDDIDYKFCTILSKR